MWTLSARSSTICASLFLAPGLGLFLAACSSSDASVGAAAVPDPAATPVAPSLGDACTTSEDCGTDLGADLGMVCLASGRCGTATCTTGSCAEGANCFLLSATERTCLPTCDAEHACRAGLVCEASGACVAPCTTASCGVDATCVTDSGLCAADTAKRPSAAPIPACDDVSPRDCTTGTSACSKLAAFDPKAGPGYDDYPINGETTANQWRSFAREDLQMIVKWSTALVACRAQHWAFGNHAPLGLGDMSEADGTIPGTSRGQPGHPAGTHVNGLDMDIGYYQTTPADTRLRAICPHTENGQDAYHCVSAPNSLDTWRNALVLGAMTTSRRVRVIGMDGKVGPLVTAALPALCRDGYLDKTACTRARSLLTYEETNTGAGWFQFHHHHFHISMSSAAYASTPASFAPMSEGQALWRSSEPRTSIDHFEGISGHCDIQ